MKATVETSELLSALSRLKPIFGGSVTLPILGTVLIQPHEGALELRATNLDTALSVKIPCKVKGSEGVCVPGSRLLAASSKISGKEVDLNFNGKALVMSAGGWSVKLYVLPAGEFPAPMACDEHEDVVTDGTALARSLRAALRFVSDDSTRYVLCGVLFDRHEGHLRLAATDGRRLFTATIETPGADRPVIVATHAVKQLVEMADGQSNVTLRIGNNLLIASSGEWQLSTRVIEGNYPGFEQVIPARGGKHQLRLPRKLLVAALPFVESIAVKGQAATVRFVCQDSKTVLVESSSPDIGETQVKLNATAEGGELKVCYNGKFLSDALESMAGDDVTFDMADEMSPALIEEAGSLAVLMPMRIQ